MQINWKFQMVVIIGEDELKENKVKVKDMETGEEKIIEMDIQKIINALK